MSNELKIHDHRDILLAPVVSEKSYGLLDENKYTFLVDPRANKTEIKIAVEKVFGVKVTSVNKANGDTLFLLELDYGGIFSIEGVPQDQLHPFLLIECPRLLFPYIRRIISDVTHDGGFPPLNIDNVDFLALYRQEIARRQAMAQPVGTA